MIQRTGYEGTLAARLGGTLLRRSSSTIWRFAKGKPLGASGGAVFLIIVLAAVFAPWVAPYDPYAVYPKLSIATPSLQHWLGNDDLGRDMLSRIIHGGRYSLVAATLAVSIAITVGSLLGITSAWYGGKVDLFFQRVVDSMQAIPGILLAIGVVSVLGPDIRNVAIAIGVSSIARDIRITRGAALSVKENTYVEAAVAIGASTRRIMFRHILPNVAPLIIVVVTISFGGAILAETSLSFLGVGIQPPLPSWGAMLSGNAAGFFQVAPHLAIAPGIVITAVVFAVNVFGDALRDVLDPRLRGSQRR
jgi:peptide/nickel transport system permease protein